MTTTTSDTSVGQMLDAALRRLEDLVRQAQGSASANQRVAALARQLETMAQELQFLRERVSTLGTNAGTSQVRAFAEEVARLNDRVDSLWSDLEGELARHRDRLDGHDAVLASHSQRLEGVEVLANANATIIARMASTVRGIRPLAWVLGALTGVVATLIWASHNWTSQLATSTGRLTVSNTAANSVWAAILFGLGVGLVVLCIVSLFPNGERDDGEVTAAANATAQARIDQQQEAPTQEQPAVPADQPVVGV